MKVDQKWRSTRPQKVRPPLPVWAKNAHMTRLSSKLFFKKSAPETQNRSLNTQKMVKMTVFEAFLKPFLKKCKNIEIREISATMCYTVKIYISAHKTHPVRLRSDSGAVLSFLGLTGHHPGGFSHPCSA